MNKDLPPIPTSAPRESLVVATSRENLKAVICPFLSACFLAGVLLVCVPLMPLFPQPTLDSAWGYALNQAVANRMVFGRDIIFTFGPYACANTWQYHPATDSLMVAANTLFGLAIAAGSLSLVSRGQLAYLLPLSAVIALVGRDAFPFILPLLFLIVCVRLTLPAGHRRKLIPDWRVAVALALMTLALHGNVPIRVGNGAIGVYHLAGDS